MPNSNTNGGLSLEALLAAARGAQQEPVETSAAPVVAEPEPTPARASSAAPAAKSAAAGANAAGTSAARAQGASAQRTAAAEPVAEPSAVVQEEALERAEEAAPAFDLAAALGYGSRASEPAVSAQEPEEKFDLAAALGYKSFEMPEREATPATTSASAPVAEAAVQPQPIQEPVVRETVREERTQDTQPTRPQPIEHAERPEAVRPERTQQATKREERTERTEQAAPAAAEQTAKREERPTSQSVAQPSVREERTQSSTSTKREEDQADGKVIATVRDADRPQVRSRSFEKSGKPVSPEERYAAKSAAAQSATASDGSTIESYQPTKRDRSAQARAARPLKKAEVSEVAQAIAAQTAATEFVEEVVEEKAETSATEAKAEVKDTKPSTASTASAEPVAEPSVAVQEKAFEKAEERFTKPSDKQAAPLGDATVSKEPAPPTDEPVIVVDKPVATPAQPKPVDAPAPVGQPLPVIPPANPVKPVTMPHKVPVRTTEEIIKPTQEPIKLGVISPEAVRHETAAKKKVQSAERKIVKKVRRFRTLGMFLIVLALAALAGAIFLFVAGNAQANESIEATATEICEQAGRTITYRYKAADSNGTLCPTTEVATFSAGDVLEQSVITMNTPDFETAAHTLANFKKQFQDNSYVDGRVDGSTVIFTLHMSSERIMKVTYTALLMKNTTGCEVII